MISPAGTFLISALILSSAVKMVADQHRHPADSKERLGNIVFPTSCSDGVQQEVERGVAMIHSFWYDAASAQFTEITSKDANCAIAYWGQAMAAYHMGWGAPTKAELASGFKLIEKADSFPSKTPREAAYFRALMALYRDYDKISAEK